MSKLLPRLRGGAGGGCPVLVFGIRAALLYADIPDEDVKTLQREHKEAKNSKGKILGPTVMKYFTPEELKKPQDPEDES